MLTVTGRVRALAIAGIVLSGSGGFLIHFRAHWIVKNDVFVPYGLVPLCAAVISIIVVPWLFAAGRRSDLAQLLNGMTAIVGAIAMTHIMIAHASAAHFAKSIFINGTLPDSLLACGKWVLGQLLFEFDADRLAQRGFDDPSKRAAWWRFLRPGWWGIHLAAMGGVYTAGVFIFQ
jgi:hypothetical protein